MENTKYLVTITEKGLIKISAMDEIKEQKRAGSGIKVCSLTAKSGPVVDTAVVEELEGNLLVVTAGGRGIKFPIGVLRVMGRTASGVMAIRIKDNEKVVSVEVV